MSGLLGLAAALAVIAVAIRVLQLRAIERVRPGASPKKAIPIEDFGEIDIAVRLQTCPCGGHYALLGESPVSDPEKNLRVVRLECRRCERERRIYFDLSPIRH